MDEGHAHYFNVMGLLDAMWSSGQVIVVDDGYRIEREYLRNMDSESWAYRYYLRFSRSNRVRHVSGRLPNRISRGLRRLTFDSDDDVFVAVAHRTSSGRLVAEESDYSTSVVDYLASEGIRVINCEVALAEATG